MKTPWKVCLRSTLLLTVWQVPPAVGQTNQLFPREMVEKAYEAMNLRAKGMPGYELRGDVQIWSQKGAASRGKYLFFWTPEGKWREEISFNGYKRTRIGDGRQFWQVRSSDIENARIFELDRLLKVRRELRNEEPGGLLLAHPEKIEGASVDCIRKASSKSSPQTLCFDPDSVDLRSSAPETTSEAMTWRFQREEYSDYQKWNGKRFPRRLQGFNGKQKVIEVQFEELRPLEQATTELFAPANGASVWLDCAEDEVWKTLRKLQPVYPVSARQRWEEGTVVLYAVIEDDGRVSDLNIVSSSGNVLDQAAVKAVSQWQYQRAAACADSKGRRETLIDIIFTLRH